MGHHPGRRPRQPHPAARPSPRSCCRWAAGGTRRDERPCAVSEYLVERMILGGADKLCFVISPGKSDIMEYFGAAYGRAPIAYIVQPQPVGLCDAIFRAGPADRAGRDGDGRAARHRLVSRATRSRSCPTTGCPSCCSRSTRPELFDAVELDAGGRVREHPGQAGRRRGSHWIWGAFKMPGRVFHELRGSGACAERARRISRHAGQRLARRGRRGRSASRPATPMSMSARCTATALRCSLLERRGGIGNR